MTYIDSVKWPEAHEAIRQRMLAQPRGYQARVAEKLGKTPGFIHQIINGKRPIPMDSLDVILDSLGMTYEVTVTDKV